MSYSNYFDKPDLGFNTTTYEFDYFSGSQIGVYLGDILIDDIAGIQYNLSQSKRPVYGYASQYWHVVPSGQIIVEGAFSVPFKEAGYLPIILAEYSHKMESAVPIWEGKKNGEYIVMKTM